MNTFKESEWQYFLPTRAGDKGRIKATVKLQSGKVLRLSFETEDPKEDFRNLGYWQDQSEEIFVAAITGARQLELFKLPVPEEPFPF